MSSEYYVPLCKVGQTLLPTEGEHEGCEVLGLYTVTKEFDPEVQLRAWAALTERAIDKHGVVREAAFTNGPQFFPWLGSCGFVEARQYRAIHTGEYGDVQLSEHRKLTNAVVTTTK